LTQATLFNYDNLKDDKSFLYKDLCEAGYVDSHKYQILRLLWDLKSHASKEIQFAGGSQYNARVLELRREGWNIISERGFDTPISTYFRLINRQQRFVR
jgi:hypothetical protein